MIGALPPKAYANFCMLTKIDIEDAIALAPVWTYDPQGEKIGARASPWRLSDYIAALYLAKNPHALTGLAKPQGAFGPLTRKRETTDSDGIVVKSAKVLHRDGV